ncbi:helix-turn-helix domain-containing protein [Streptomyces glaucosporus]|uniref:Helix-turn-helix domain-containing protein n=1 Tax=Streptomyces glaucosporus TaxID=284044 RepID=A0ABN3HRM4_9ACTN
METVFDTAALPVRDRVGAWVEVTALALVTTEFKVTHPSAFGARLRATTLGAVQVTRMSYGPLVSRRTPALIRRSDPEHYQVALVRSGRQGIEQARNRARLGPGDIVLYDSSRPFDAPVEAGRGMSESVLLQFPKRLLPLPESKAARLLAVPLPGTRGVGRVLTRFVDTLTDESAGCTAHDRARLGHTALDLVTAVLAHHLDDTAAVPSRSPRHALFLRMTAFIDQNLHDPGLGPAAVATAHQISLRYVHRIFQEHGTSVGAHIRQRRLDRCRRDLADPALRHLTVHAIAARWGFTRPADFSRVFRAATGMPPGRYRESACPAAVAAPVS